MLSMPTAGKNYNNPFEGNSQISLYSAIILAKLYHYLQSATLSQSSPVC
jgi:hypothetical protein